MAAFLTIRGLQTCFDTAYGRVFAVDDVDLDLAAGETLGVVGESGCGKTVLALSVLRLVPKPAGKIVNGRIMLRDKDLLSLDERSMRAVRGRDIAMVFQEPMNALNPVFPVG
ncbi:MAG: ATP-binding cassette domain-containing protein, partial [Syntrophales bacterium]|nr:ATP-binding cassette domain-containing protein [Syntrophales bacterium]